MNTIASLLALLLASVFSLSAIGKLRETDHGRSALTSLRIESPAPRATVIAIIAVELLTALALVIMTGWPFLIASVAAFALVTALLIVVVRAYRLGSNDDCGCFGEWMPARIGPSLILRNVVLVFLTVLLVVFGSIAQGLQGGASGVPGALAEVVAGDTSPLVVVFGAALTGLLVYVTILPTRIHTPAPRATVTRERGEGALFLPRSASVVDAFAPSARARLVLFTSLGCHACAAALDTVRSNRSQLDQIVDVVEVSVITAGALAKMPRRIDPPYPMPAVDVGGSLARALNLGPGRPQAALLSTLGEQVGPIATGSAEITELVAGLTAVAEAAPHGPPASSRP